MKRAGAILCVLTVLVLPAAAADTGAVTDQVRQTLLYGIDSQVMDALQTLKTAWDPAFTKDLVTILTDKRSTTLQAAVLGIFRDQALKDGEEPAKTIVDGWQDAQSDLAIAAVRYLAAIHSDGLPAKLAPIIDSTDNALATAVIEALGIAGDSSSAKLLSDKLTSLDYPDTRKADLILALGTLKDKSAVDVLLAIAKNADEDKIRRLYAADALGKIGDPGALPVLRDMFAENDALVRQYAASAIARFGLQEIFDNLIQGLRDEDAKVRESSAKALAAPMSPAQSATAVPILSFKAEQDPVSQVRIASINALGAIGGDAAMKKLLDIYGRADRPLDSREAALTILVAKALPTTMDTIKKVLDAEWKAYDTHTLESTAKVLSTTKDASLKDLFVHFLDSPDPVVRSYGARGIALNGFSDQKDRLQKMAGTDPNPGTRQEAQRAAAKL